MATKGALRVIEAFAKTEHRLLAHDYRGMLTEEIIGSMRHADAVFLMLHGGAGEGGDLQQELERADIYHYTGTDPSSAALALDKARAKACVAKAGVPVAAGAVWQPQEKVPAVRLPAILKPLSGGSSVGLFQIKTRAALKQFTPNEPMLLEEYLSGREFTVGVLGNTALPAVEIIPNGGIYDYQHKYTPGATVELCPAPIDTEKAELLGKLALLSFRSLGLRDFARIDFKEDAAGVPCFLEANTLPGMTETSLLPLAAGAAGLSFVALCTYMAECAARRRRNI